MAITDMSKKSNDGRKKDRIRTMTKSKFELPQKEIKFRAWDRKKKEMTYKPRVDDLKIDGTAWLDVNEALKFEERDYVLMQYTGLKDKNGKEIYEGDILRSSTKLNPDYRFEVKWEVPNSCGCCDQCSGWNVDIHTEYEIIGNIYETPELLEGKRKK